jgi:general secretion pathway protein J
MRSPRRGARGLAAEQDGFTLFEALIAVALMSVILATLATVTSRWMPNWKAGFVRVQRTDLLGLGLERIVADLAAAEFVSADSQNKRPLFEGTPSSVTFVRSAIGPNSSAGLEIVQLAETTDERGFALARARAPFRLIGSRVPDAEPFAFSDSIALVRSPYRISFAFAGRDRAWRETWRDAAMLPRAIRVIVHDAASGKVLTVSTTAMPHVNAPAECAPMTSAWGCVEQLENNADPSANQETAPERRH